MPNSPIRMLLQRCLSDKCHPGQELVRNGDRSSIGVHAVPRYCCLQLETDESLSKTWRTGSPLPHLSCVLQSKGVGVDAAEMQHLLELLVMSTMKHDYRSTEQQLAPDTTLMPRPFRAWCELSPPQSNRSAIVNMTCLRRAVILTLPKPLGHPTPPAASTVI
jgi:hypothetical protein